MAPLPFKQSSTASTRPSVLPPLPDINAAVTRLMRGSGPGMTGTLRSRSDLEDALLDTFTILPHLRDLGIAYALAFPIAWDRERTERSAGLRTFPLVAIASCSFIQASEGMLLQHPEASARIVEGIITGIGFIGGGAILKHGDSVRGTATAASLWATGAIGAAVGLGTYDVACVVSLFTTATLRLLTRFKRAGQAQADQ